MTISSVQALLLRELRALRRNIELYPNDESLWALPPGIGNSGGTLALHLAGNLQHYVGAVLGGSSYVRDRPAEFSQRDVSRDQLLAQIDAATHAVERGLTGVSEESLRAQFPEAVAGMNFSTGDFLLHLMAHIGYHMGQIDYHRRLVTGENRTADAVSVREIPKL